LQTDSTYESGLQLKLWKDSFKQKTSNVK